MKSNDELENEEVEAKLLGAIAHLETAFECLIRRIQLLEEENAVLNMQIKNNIKDEEHDFIDEQTKIEVRALVKNFRQTLMKRARNF